jgi:hypothetical protein
MGGGRGVERRRTGPYIYSVYIYIQHISNIGFKWLRAEFYLGFTKPEMEPRNGSVFRKIASKLGKKTIAGNKGADGGDNQKYIDIIGAPSWQS